MIFRRSLQVIAHTLQEIFNFFLTDTMDKWDETKLKDVVDKKHGEGNKQKNKTEIVSILLLYILDYTFWSYCHDVVVAF